MFQLRCNTTVRPACPSAQAAQLCLSMYNHELRCNILLFLYLWEFRWSAVLKSLKMHFFYLNKEIHLCIIREITLIEIVRVIMQMHLRCKHSKCNSHILINAHTKMGEGDKEGSNEWSTEKNGCHGMLNQCLKDLPAISDHIGKAFQCVSPLVSTHVTCNLLINMLHT